MLEILDKGLVEEVKSEVESASSPGKKESKDVSSVSTAGPVASTSTTTTTTASISSPLDVIGVATTCENGDPTTCMHSVVEAREIQKGQDDLVDGLNDDIDKSAALEEIAEWTPAKSSPFYEIARYIYAK
ncbi:hypothetical protein BGX33_001766, partial [Mortierella sp. NVP41]